MKGKDGPPQSVRLSEWLGHNEKGLNMNIHKLPELPIRNSAVFWVVVVLASGVALFLGAWASVLWLMGAL